jgi:hypothetical protein
LTIATGAVNHLIVADLCTSGEQILKYDRIDPIGRRVNNCSETV